MDLPGSWTSELILGGFRKCTLWLFMAHWIGIQIPVWAYLNKGLVDNGPECKISVNQDQPLFGVFLIHLYTLVCQGQIHLSSKWELLIPSTWRPHYTASGGSQGYNPIIPYNYGHRKQAGSGLSHHTTNQHPKKKRACAYPPVENQPEIYWF